MRLEGYCSSNHFIQSVHLRMHMMKSNDTKALQQMRNNQIDEPLGDGQIMPLIPLSEEQPSVSITELWIHVYGWLETAKRHLADYMQSRHKGSLRCIEFNKDSELDNLVVGYHGTASSSRDDGLQTIKDKRHRPAEKRKRYIALTNRAATIAIVGALLWSKTQDKLLAALGLVTSVALGGALFYHARESSRLDQAIKTVEGLLQKAHNLELEDQDRDTLAQVGSWKRTMYIRL
ncbi:hypothetical protein B0I35DRAFT_85967 [Stachybotrys elegans]|uniref:Uncharacterized protein n=1 Tax=Stachybotrys elegans TaxID=80388 RepID=A0A8K0SK70_9HYPO|nr:hypothetical protein B0I35DRAFT_85967 [Stachybotrys elegans]